MVALRDYSVLRLHTSGLYALRTEVAAVVPSKQTTLTNRTSAISEAEELTRARNRCPG